MFPIEHIGRKLQGTVVALNIFQKTSSNDALASRALVDFISEAISQTEFLRNYFEDASSTDREYTYAFTRKLAQFAGMKLLTIVVVTSDERVITLRRTVFKDVLISSILGQRLGQHLVSKENQSRKD